MQNKRRNLYLLGILVVAVPSLAAIVLSWSISRIANQPAEVGQLWFAAGGFVASGWALVALIGTFYEQRKLTQNASRAVLEVKGIRVHPSSMDSFWLFFKIHNHGQTPAFRIISTGTLTFAPEVSDSGQLLGKKVTQDFHSSELGLVASLAEGDLRYLCGDSALFLRLPLDGGRSPYIGTEHSQPAQLFIKGIVVYFDVFEQRHELPFEMKMYEMRGETAFVHMSAGFIGG